MINSFKTIFSLHHLLFKFSIEVYIAIIGISIASGVSYLALGISKGYLKEIKEKILYSNAPIMVYPLGEDDYKKFQTIIAESPVKTSVNRVFFTQGAIIKNGQSERVTIRIIDDNQKDSLSGATFSSNKNIAPLAIGKVLADKMRISLDDEITIVAIVKGTKHNFKVISAKVEKIFSTGLYEFDSEWITTSSTFLPNAASKIYEIHIDSPTRKSIEKMQQWIDNRLGDTYLSFNWYTLNTPLFNALELQEKTLYFFLTLIITVALANLSATLLTLINKKIPEFGILLAIGIDPAIIYSSLILTNLLFTTIGITIGTIVGIVSTILIEKFGLLNLPESLADIYFIARIPIHNEVDTVLHIFAIALTSALMLSSIPIIYLKRIKITQMISY